MSPATTRTWVALALAEFWFTLVYVPFAAASLAVAGATDQVESGDIGLFVSLVVFGGFALLGGLPIAVHTVGRLTERFTASWPRSRSLLAHVAVGLLLGVAVAVFVTANGLSNLPSTLVAFAVPCALVAGLTHLLVPFAARHVWVVVVAWVVAVPGIVISALWAIGMLLEGV